jgi:two-component system response regulator PrrA
MATTAVHPTGTPANGADRPHVLVVDDDAAIRAALERGLRLGGFRVTTAEGGLAALERLADSPPDVVVLDVGMPDLDGVTVCRRVRDAGFDVPICILSALDDIDDRLAGLRAGADDYLVKPFALEELRLRLLALLRRAAPARRDTPGDVLRVGPLCVDVRGRQVWMGERSVEVTRREFELLAALARSSPAVLTRDELLAGVWGYDFDVNTNVVDVFVGYLRRKLESGGEARLLHTVRGVGFVLRP